ncbi:MAG: hypothetical protein WAO98_11260 [Alphaproteobacteria bacterium]
MADPSLPFYGYVFGFIKDGLMQATTGLPPEAWWLPAVVLLILGAAALIDSFTSNVPDPLIFLGLLAVTAMQGLYVSWPFAAQHLMLALAAAITIWAINQAWYYGFRHDALGMGDAKWTMLAVSCFDIKPVLVAWGLGAILALVWMGVMKIARCEITRVYFAPFLFIGLLAGIYWLRLKA